MPLENEWILKTPPAQVVQALAKGLDISLNLAGLLVNRGLDDPAKAQHFLEGSLADLPDPFTMKEMDKAVERLGQAIRKNEFVCVWGDYDIDGMTSTSLLVRFLRRLGLKPRWYLPDRLEEGYGLNAEGIRLLAQEGVTLIVTVDNGIRSLEESHVAADLKVDLIVVDHHEVGDDLPKAVAVLNPKRPDCPFPDKNLAAVGVTLMLCAGLRRYVTEEGIANGRDVALKDYLDLVTLGTVCDLVPLVGVNRILVKHGLPLLSRGIRPGVLALKEALKMAPTKDIGTYDVGYILGPPINAGGRIGQPDVGVRLLTTESITEARESAKALVEWNFIRRQMGQQIEIQAMEMAEEADEDEPVLFFARDGWHEGVIGIVANQLLQQYNKPVFLVSLKPDGARGSCRSIPGFHIKLALDLCADLLDQYGGHAAAAGFGVRSDKLPALKERLKIIARQALGPEDYRKKMSVDATLDPFAIDQDLLNDLTRLEPYGMKNPRPVFRADEVPVLKARLLNQKHWKLDLGDETRHVEAIGFNMGKKELKEASKLAMLFNPEINVFRGRSRLQLKVKDVRTPDGVEQKR